MRARAMSKPKLDEYHYHEAADRLHVIMDTIDDHLIQHPVLKLDIEPRRLVEQAQTLLFEAYQMIGETRFKMHE